MCGTHFWVLTCDTMGVFPEAGTAFANGYASRNWLFETRYHMMLSNPGTFFSIHASVIVQYGIHNLLLMLLFAINIP